jgi:FkbH-like protein
VSPDCVKSPAGLARQALGAASRLKPVEIFVHGTRLLGAADGGMRIAIAGSCTTDMIARAAAVGAVQEGFDPAIFQAGFGAWQQEALGSNSATLAFAPDVVLLVNTWRDVVVDLPLGCTKAEIAASVAAQVAAFRLVWDRLLAGAPGRRIIQHLPATPSWALGGVAELRLASSPRAQVAAFREAVLEAGPDIVFVETDGLKPDDAAWFGAKLPFAQDVLPDYLARFRAALRQVTGRMKKLLVLDLDNTLWGGVIGDDGLDGLELGAGTPKGEAFASFQAYARALAARGVVLAVCSKNDEATAEIGFTHSGSVLARDDFAAFECGWGDKPAAIRRIVEQLNLGIDSVVFADDNPAECALVRDALPSVAVVELGADPAQFVARLEQGCWFEMQGLSAEDLARGRAYQARAKAAAAQAETTPTDLSGFLAGLQMRGRVFAAGEADFSRVAQLEAKTNQFNLTGRRLTETVIRDFAGRADGLVLAATLKDKFGDHGLVSSLVASVDGETMTIISWVMSCRVFSRTLEEFFLLRLIEAARDRGVARLRGQFVPSEKNSVVAGLFSRLGFAAEADETGWVRDISAETVELTTYVVAV